MSQSETDDNDVAESDQSTRESLYPTDPPKRRHKKKKKVKKCKTMRRICFRVPKLIFLTLIGLLVVFSMKRLSEQGKDTDSNSTVSPDDVTQAADYPDGGDNEGPAMADGAVEEELGPNLSGFEREINKSAEGIDEKKSELKPAENEEEEETDDGGEEGPIGKHLQYRIKRAGDRAVKKGREFKFQDRKKGVAEIVAKEVEPDDEATAGHAVIVTGVYDAIFQDVLKLVASVQKHLPHTTIVIFEINLSDTFKDQLLKACNVDIRPFWVDIFPEHLQDLDNRSWRPFVIQLALAEFHFVAWIDPQTRLTNSRIEPALRMATSSGVAVVSSASRRSPVTQTHPDMFQFLPTDEARLDTLPHMHITMLVLHNSDELQDNFMKWLLLCASEKECLSPKGASSDCESYQLARNRGDTICHKYDESAVNILLANWFDFDMRPFYIKDSITAPTSKRDKPGKIQICNYKGQKRDL